MHECRMRITGLTPYSQSKFHETPKLNKESPHDYEARTWREFMHVDDKGNVFIPCTAFKNCLSEAAKYLGIQIQGKGKATYTKHFEAGILVAENIPIGQTKDDAIGEWLFLPSDGKRGSGKRVSKCYPRFDKWGGAATIVVLDDTVTKDVLEQHAREAGRFIGLGRFRPRNNGYYGRFEIEILEWK